MNEVTPMSHELRTMLNAELNAWAELRDKLKEFNSNMDNLLEKLKETVPLLTNYVNTNTAENEEGL